MTAGDLDDKAAPVHKKRKLATRATKKKGRMEPQAAKGKNYRSSGNTMGIVDQIEEAMTYSHCEIRQTWEGFMTLLDVCAEQAKAFVRWTCEQPIQASRFFSSLLGAGNISAANVEQATWHFFQRPYIARNSVMVEDWSDEAVSGEKSGSKTSLKNKKDRERRALMKDDAKNQIVFISSNGREPKRRPLLYSHISPDFRLSQRICNYLHGLGDDAFPLAHRDLCVRRPWMLPEMLDSIETYLQNRKEGSKEALSLPEIRDRVDSVIEAHRKEAITTAGQNESEDDDDDEEADGGGSARNRRDATAKSQWEKLHGMDLSAQIIKHLSSACCAIYDETGQDLLVAAAALAVPRVFACLHECNLPLELFFGSGLPFLRSMKFSDHDIESLKRSVEDDFQLRVRCNPLIPVDTRKRLVKQKGAFCVLSPMVIVCEDGALTERCKDAWIKHQNTLRFCRQSDSSYVRASVVRHDPAKEEEPPFDGDFLNPIAHIGSACVLGVPASTQEVLFMRVKQDFANMLIDATNEMAGILAGEPTEDEGSWRTRYASDLAREKMGEYRHYLPMELASEISKKISVGGLLEKFQPIPPASINMNIMKKGKGYGPHQDGEFAMNSEEGTAVEKSDGTILPTRKQMNVVTIVLAVSEEEGGDKKARNHKNRSNSQEDAKASLYHFCRNEKPASNAYSNVHTYGTSFHTQSSGTQFGHREIVHASNSYGSAQRQTDTARCTLDPEHELEEYLRSLSKDGISFPRLKSELVAATTKGKTTVYHAYNFTKVFQRKPELMQAAEPACLWWENNDKVSAALHRIEDPENPPSIMLKPTPLPITAAHFQALTKKTIIAVGRTADEEKAERIRGISRTQRILQLSARKDGGKYQLAYHRKVVESALRKGWLLKLKDTKIQPLHFLKDHNMPFCPADWYRSSDFPMLEISKMSKQLICGTHLGVLHVIWLYKNGYVKIDVLAVLLFKLRRFLFQPNYPERSEPHKLEKLQREYDAFRENETMDIGGIGGSGRKAGCHAFSAKTSKPSDPHTTTGKSQSHLCQELRAFFYALEHQNVLNFAAHEIWFGPRRDPSNPLLDELGGHDKKKKPKRGTTTSDRLDSGEGEQQDLHNSEDIFGCAQKSNKVTLRTDGNSILNLCPVVVDSITYTTDTYREIWRNYKGVPGYLRQQSDNLSFRLNGYFNIKCRPAFASEVLVDILLRHRARQMVWYHTKEDVEAYKVKELDKCTDSAVVDTDGLERHYVGKLSREDKEFFIDGLGIKANEQGDPETIPSYYYTRHDVADYLASMPPDDMFKHLSKDEESGVKDSLLKQNYAITPRQMIVVAAALMVSASFRSDRELCLGPNPFASETPASKQCYYLPLVCQGSDKLPDPLRTKPISCSMPSLDIARSCVRSNVGYRVEELENGEVPCRKRREQKPKLVPLEGYPGSYKLPDLTHLGNRLLLADCIMTALFFRLTGRVETLQCFPQWNSQRPDPAR